MSAGPPDLRKSPFAALTAKGAIRLDSNYDRIGRRWPFRQPPQATLVVDCFVLDGRTHCTEHISEIIRRIPESILGFSGGPTP